LLGAEPDRIEALWQRMWWALHYGGRGGSASLAVSAVDIALWDLKARRFGTPLWRLLDGHDPRVPAYAVFLSRKLSVTELRDSMDPD
jgi:L-alanine-DL-glutamate epimerase-like enolase superfamily enzyme